MSADVARKKKGNFLSKRAQSAKKTITPEELQSRGGNVTPEDVLMLSAATEGEILLL